MKRFIFSFFLCGMILSVFAQNDRMYVFRNDDDFNVFSVADIDSITFSEYDLDSIRQDTVCTQVVWTEDSIYRIPIENIDSVTFSEPKTKYAKNVVRIESDWLPAISKVDGMTISFTGEIEQFYKPVKGDILIYENFDSYFPSGFAGRVVKINNTNGFDVLCDSVTFDQVYDCYVHSGEYYIYNEGTKDSPLYKMASKRVPGWQPKIELTIPATDNISISGLLGLTFIPEFLQQGNKTIFKITIEDEEEFTATLSGDVGVNAFLESKPIKIEFRIPNTPFLINTEVSLFSEIELKGELSGKATLASGGSQTISFGRSLKDFGREKKPRKPKDIQYTIDGGITGKMGVGVAPVISIKAIGDIVETKSKLYISSGLKSTFEAKAGWSSEQAWIANYDATLDWYVDFRLVTAAKMKLLGYEFNEEEELWNLSITLNSWYYFPEASNTSKDVLTNRCVDFATSLSRNTPVFFDYQLGYRIYDTDDNIVKTEYTNCFYRKEKDFQRRYSELQMCDLERNKDYYAKPVFKWFKFEIPAKDSVQFSLADVSITNFQITDTTYSKDAKFEYEGEYYKYRFSCDVTVELLDTTGVIDWGYAYIDPKGDTAFISLTDFESPYTDSRYVYYRNEASSTLVLIPYSKHKNDTENTFGQKRTFDLLYSFYCNSPHHPHLVDLGLPSGTLWACSNVNAKNPEDFGGFYAYGEKKEKNFYSQSNYPFIIDYGYGYKEYALSGDISGGSFDVAREICGYDWVIPNLKQIRELSDSCVWTWEETNGVTGYKVTGPNGNSIFLPAAGFKSSEHMSAGVRGEYVSSYSIGDKVYVIDFTEEKHEVKTWSPVNGRTVRPVGRKKKDQ